MRESLPIEPALEPKGKGTLPSAAKTPRSESPGKNKLSVTHGKSMAPPTSLVQEVDPLAVDNPIDPLVADPEREEVAEDLAADEARAEDLEAKHEAEQAVEEDSDYDEEPQGLVSAAQEVLVEIITSMPCTITIACHGRP